MRKYLGLLLAVSVLSLSGASAWADNQPALTQTYSADSSVLAGMVVELKPKAVNTVTPLTTSDLKHMLGVVVPANDAPIVLTSPSVTTQQVLVASTGHYNMLVSNQDGVIKTGDYLSISALAGIAMKANASQPEIVAQAAGDFNGSSNVLGSVPLQDSAGGKVTETIGSIPVNVRMAANPLYQKSTTAAVPSFLSKAANSLANKPVNAVRVYLGAIVMLATVLLTGSMLYSGVRTGMIAVGRNPLAKKIIGRSLLQIIVTGLIIFIIGVSLAYLILKL